MTQFSRKDNGTAHLNKQHKGLGSIERLPTLAIQPEKCDMMPTPSQDPNYASKEHKTGMLRTTFW